MHVQQMPFRAVVTVCTLLLALAVVMALQSLALAADGSFQLVRVLGSESVYGSESRFLGAAVRQGAVIFAARGGVTDTHLLSILLGIGQLVVPALIWTLAIALSRSDQVACAAVVMVAGLSAGALSLANVCEIALALPLTTLVAVLLGQPGDWRRREATLAVTASFVLVASYETAALTSFALAVWAMSRARRSHTASDRYGCAAVTVLSLAAVLVAVTSMDAGRNPMHSRSLLYFVVSLEPWPFYAALVGIGTVTVVAMLGSWCNPIGRRLGLTLGCTALVVAVAGFEPSVTTAFQARGGVAVAGLMLLVFLWTRWIGWRRWNEAHLSTWLGSRYRFRPLVDVPVAFVVAMVAMNVGPMNSWSRSLDAVRSEVDQTEGIAIARDVVPSNRQAALWSWTGSSLSLIVRSSADGAGVLVDSDPSYVPFPPTLARYELPDAYAWREDWRLGAR